MTATCILTVMALTEAAQSANRSFDVPVLFVKPGDNPEGSVGKMEFSLRRSGDGPREQFRVSISEDYAMGTADDAVASVWMGATVASLLTSKSLSGYELTARFSGATGGPSAGGVYCLAILAALTHKTLPDDLVITGTIMPDGGLGPVAGIPYKLLAAKEAGFRRAIIPLFSRMEDFRDPDSGDVKAVDPVEFGEKLGLKVITVESIEDAYSVAFEVPLRKRKAASHPIRYSERISSALRLDRDALLRSIEQNPEERKKFQEFISDFPEDSKKDINQFLALADSAKEASLLSVSHFRAASGVPLVRAIQRTIKDVQKISRDETALRKSIETASGEVKRKSENLEGLNRKGRNESDWREMQLEPDVSMVYFLATSVAALQTEAQKESDLRKLTAAWAEAHFLANWFDAFAGEEFPFARTVVAIHQGQNELTEQLDSDTLDILLQQLITAGRVNAKAAQRVALQRATELGGARSEFGLQAAYRLNSAGAIYESRLQFVDQISKEDPKSSSQMVRACIMAAELLADSAADFIVYETIGAISPSETQTQGNHKAKSNKADVENAAPLKVANRELAGHLIGVARKHAEGEISELLDEYEDAVLPVYSFELAESFTQRGVENPDSVHNALSHYYRAYLTAAILHEFLDSERGRPR